MKNKKMHGAIVLLFCLLWLSASACSGSVRGTIYLDENNNDIRDLDEVGVPYAKVTVIHNGKAIGTGYTDTKGYFSVKSQGSGQYCVDTNLDESAVRLGEVGFNVSSLKVGPLKTQAIGTGTTQSTLTTGGTGGAPATTGGIQTTTGGTSTGATGTQTGGTGATTQTANDTRQADTTVPGRFCQASKQGSLGTIEFEIPVTLDYTTELANFAPIDKACSSTAAPAATASFDGDACEISFPVPAGCKVKPLYLPQWINLAAEFQAGVIWRPELNMVVFDDAIPATKSANAQKSADLNIGVSKLGSRTLKLQVNSELPVDASEKVILTPKYDCPTGEVKGPQITLTLTNKPRLFVYLESLDPVSRILVNEHKEDLRVNVTVENKGKNPVADAELTVDMPMGVIVQRPIKNLADDSDATDCRSLNENVQCTIRNLAAGAKVTYRMKIDIVWTSGDTEARKIDANVAIARDGPPAAPAVTGTTDPTTTTAADAIAAPIEFTVEVPPPGEEEPANP